VVHDILGQLKSFSINAEELEDAFEGGMGFDGSSITGFNPIEESDMIAMPDPATFRILPWRPDDGRRARMFCDVRCPAASPMRATRAGSAALARADAVDGLRPVLHRPRARVLLLPLRGRVDRTAEVLDRGVTST
jgi:glutamine synthetase